MPAANSIPPALPPSVEEAYRRKCIQLKQRTNEVEEANDAARLRLQRLKRQVEKMRLERAFLLEQLAKRTSTNVEDSDGSPSPPPTPKEKPLRIKRGHRKPSLLANLDTTPSAGPTFISQNPQALSPSSDAFSTQPHGDGKANGLPGNPFGKQPPSKRGSAFELFCAEAGPALKEENKDNDLFDFKTALEEAWKELDEEKRKEWDDKFEKEERLAASDKADHNGEPGHGDKEKESGAAESTPRATQDEDVEMTNYDTDQETQGEKPDD